MVIRTVSKNLDVVGRKFKEGDKLIIVDDTLLHVTIGNEMNPEILKTPWSCVSPECRKKLIFNSEVVNG